MILKKCTKCGRFFQYNGKSRCPECNITDNRKENDRIYNQRFRNKQSDRFYHSAEWKKLSRLVLIKANYRCAECGKLAVEVHHIVPVTEAPERRLDITNLTPLCTACHNKQRL